MKIFVPFLVLIVSWNFSLSQLYEVDSLKKILNASREDTVLVSHYINIADAYSYVNIDSSLVYSKKTYDLSKKIGYNVGMGRAMNVEGQAYFRQGIYDKADSLYQLAIQFQTKINDNFGLAITTNNLGLVYMNTSKYAQAIELFLKSIEYYKSSNHEDKIPATLANIGVIYYYQNNIDMALNYMIDAAQGMKGYEAKRSIILRNIGAFYSLKNNMDSAFYYAKQAIKIDSVVGNMKGLATGYNNMAEFYGRLGNFDKAAEYFFKSLKYKKELNDQRGLMFTYHNLGLLYDTLKHYEQALDYHLKALDYAEKTNNLETQVTIYLDLSRSYQRLNDINKSFAYYRKFHALSDSLTKMMYDNDLLELQTKYDTERKEQEIDYLKQQKRIEELKNKKNRLIAIVASGSVLILLLLLYYIINLLNIKKENNEILREQNEEINQQKEEIAAQKDEIENQRDRVIEQKEFIEKQNKDINDSIIYAQQIQEAVFPREKLLKTFFDDFFIFNKPKNVVSGDFYWVKEKKDEILFVLADCTGHGVPGAFMSLLGITYLNEIFREVQVLDPSDILIRLRNKVIEGLHQEGRKKEAKDGMVVSLCLINKKEMTIKFSGAGNDLLIRNGEKFEELKGDKNNISIESKNEKFLVHEINYQKNNALYLYSDGFIDQFNTDGSRKYSRKRFFEFIQSIQNIPIHKQDDLFEGELQNWMGNFEQIDDILVCGLKL